MGYYLTPLCLLSNNWRSQLHRCAMFINSYYNIMLSTPLGHHQEKKLKYFQKSIPHWTNKGNISKHWNQKPKTPLSTKGDFLSLIQREASVHTALPTRGLLNWGTQ